MGGRSTRSVLILALATATACRGRSEDARAPDSARASSPGRAPASQRKAGSCGRGSGATTEIPAAPFADRDAHAAWTGEQLLVWDHAGNRAAGYSLARRRWTDLGSRFPGMRVRAVAGRHLLVAADGQFPKPLSGLIVDGHSGETRPFAAPTRVWLEPLPVAEALLFSGDGTTPITSDLPVHFDPARDRWTMVAGPGPTGLVHRRDPSEVVGPWFVFRWGGGDDGGTLYDDGSWIDMRAAVRHEVDGRGAPSARRRALAAGDEDRVAVWGGEDLAGWRDDGGLYDLADQRWRPIPALAGGTGDNGGDWRGLALGATHLSTWAERGGRWQIASFALTDERWTVTELPTSAWSLGSRALVDGDGRLIFVGQDRYGAFDPARGSWCERPLPDAATRRGDLRALWAGDQLLLWGGFDFGASGGCDDHRGPEGCDPYVEHLPRSDGWLLHIGR